MSRKHLLKLLISWGFTFFLAFLFLFLSKTKTYRIIDDKAYDLIFSLRGSLETDPSILHIDIDDESLDKIGRWPWPRRYHAKLIDTLSECGAKAVIMDIIFTERFKDRPKEDYILAKSLEHSGIAYLSFYFKNIKRAASLKLEKLLSKDITISIKDAADALKLDVDSIKSDFSLAKHYVMDKALRNIVRKYPDISFDEVIDKLEVTKGWYLFPAEESYVKESLGKYKVERFFVNRFSMNYKGAYIPNLLKFAAINPPIKKFSAVIKGSGFINAEPDEDGVLRKIPLYAEFENKLFAQVSFAALLDLLRVENTEFRPHFIILRGAHLYNKVTDIKIPVDSRGRMLINWAGQWGSAFKHIPYYYILRLQNVRDELKHRIQAANSKDKQSLSEIAYLKKTEEKLKDKLVKVLRGKICIVGLTATGTHDMGPIPIDTDYPFVGAHSNLINTILTHKFLRKANISVNVFIFMLVALLMGFNSLLKLWRSLILSICFAAGYFALSLFIFSRFGVWMDMVGPLGIIVLGFSGIISMRFFTEEKEKIWIKKAFSHYLSQDVINELIKDPSKLKLGGERRTLTVLFSDIKGFTSYSEKREPEEIVSILNDYLDAMTRVIFDNKGTLDKYVGDEIVAIFGAPHYEEPRISARRAVKTALEMMEKLAQLQDKWISQGLDPLDIGIGINTGDMIVGNMGSTMVMDYTVIGDAVNLGARVEGLTRRYNNSIMISEFTYKYVKDFVEVNPLEAVKVKGKEIPVMMYEVVRIKSENES